MENKKILVVDDEIDIAELVAYNLKKEGFLIDLAHDGETALRRVRDNKYDLLILDLMLPGIQGMELCRLIRNNPRSAAIPIIMLTAKSEELDKIIGLELGADDYITKPFSVRELTARVRAILRRAAPQVKTELPAQAKILKMGELEIDTEKFSVSLNNAPVKLSATEFRLLLYLAERKGRVFSREQLLDAVWRDEAFVEPRTVDVHIRRLRSHIEDDSAAPKYVKTMRGIGYFMDGDI
jgi:phosphate regulon transcriptional regulator PhoB